MTFHLTTFGSCELTDQEGKPISVPSLALVALAYLFHEGWPVSRRDLALILWDRDPSVAATNLRSMLRRFAAVMEKHDLKPLQIDDRYVTLDRQMIRCDLAIADEREPAERLSNLCDGISKGFLHDHGDGTTSLDRWVRQVRLELLKKLRSDYLALCNSPTAGILKPDLKHAAMLLLEDDPRDEEILQALLQDANPDQQSRPAQAISAHTHPIEPPHVFNPDRPKNRATLPRVALLPPEELDDLEISATTTGALIEDITIGLCASRAVSMVAPYTAQKVAVSDDRAELLNQFDVSYVLDTKRTGDKLYAQLIFMPADEILWANRFELEPNCSMDHRILISEAIQNSIVDSTRTHSPILDDFKAHPEAYSAYLKGLQSLSNLTLPSIRSAKRQFKESLNHQSKFSRALAGISRTLTMEWVLRATGEKDLLLEAERVANIAIEEDQSSAEAFKALGMCHLYLRKFDDSLHALDKAEQLSPHYADVLCSNADSLNHAGDQATALDKIDTAISLNPIPPDAYLWSAAGASYSLGEYDQALEQIRRMKDKTPALRLAAACYAMLGDTNKARAYRNRVLKDNPHFDLQHWLTIVPFKEKWQVELYKEGLERAGF